MHSNLIVILACSANKITDQYSEARNMYLGTIFKKGRALCEKHNLPYTILSAKYGLITPFQTIENYNQKFTKPYTGNFPPSPWYGFYLGGQLYFKHAPSRFEPLVAPRTIGYMLQELSELTASPELMEMKIAAAVQKYEIV